jgi:hypothetical protein
MSKNTAPSNEDKLTVTTVEAAALLKVSPARLLSEAKQNGGFCLRGRWLVWRAAEKRNCWYSYKAQKPPHQRFGMNEDRPTVTTVEAAALLKISPACLRSEAKQNGGFCLRGKWLVWRAAEKRNCWYSYKAQKPPHQRFGRIAG